MSATAVDVMRGVTPKFTATFANLEAAKAFIAEYVNQYHPDGYGTMCFTYPLADGRVTVKCFRGESCE